MTAPRPGAGRARWLAVAAATLAALLLPLAAHQPQVLSVLILALLYTYLAACWNLVGGFAGQLSLAHSAFFGLGAYTSALLFLKAGVNPWLGMALGAPVAAALGYLISTVSARFRMRGLYFALCTLAFAEVVRTVFLNVGFLGKAVGLQLPLRDSWADFQFASKLPYYYIILLMAIGVMALSAWLQSTRLGYHLVAVRENEEAAEALGVDVPRTKHTVMALSAALTALGGSFQMQLLLFAQPDVTFSIYGVIDMVLRTMVGGVGTVLGPLLGSFFFVGLDQLIRIIPLDGRQLAAFSQLLSAALLMLFILYAPEGLYGLFRRWTARPPGIAPANTNEGGSAHV